jgi:hypothetical protein
VYHVLNTAGKGWQQGVGFITEDIIRCVADAPLCSTRGGAGAAPVPGEEGRALPRTPALRPRPAAPPCPSLRAPTAPHARARARRRDHLPAPGPGVLVLRCGPLPMNKAMEAHLDAIGYAKDAQFQF